MLAVLDKMDKADPDDPKRLLRCPNGCGLAADFTAMVKCRRCGKIVCRVCTHRYRGKPFCKDCGKAEAREDARRMV